MYIRRIRRNSFTIYSMKNVVEVKDVSIKYITGDFKDIGLKDYVIKKLKGDYHVKEFWANKNISFNLQKGDMLGIVGSNGAGKSTLLTAISGVMEPSVGSIKTDGKIAALLELTAGFDGDLTAKENTYLRGSMLGYSEEFMDKMYDSIIEFAELKDFEDRPIKQFSSGMRSRLAFSIVCLVNPDIIIIDEVLAVGDSAFRKKSGQKMREILDSGVTGIIVSHSSEMLKQLCNKILWLDHGKQICFSENVKDCLNAYEEFNITRKLPKNDKEIKMMSDSYTKKIQTLKKQLNKK